MRKFIYTLALVLIVHCTLNIGNSFAQPLNSPEVISAENPLSPMAWGNDVAIINTPPVGPIDGIEITRGSTKTTYVIMNDTSTGWYMRCFKSTNGGLNWALAFTALTPAKSKNVKAFKTTDSVYVAFQYEKVVYIMNLEASGLGLRQFSTSFNVRNFDIVTTSTNSFYLYYVDFTNAQLYYASSTTRGKTWGTANFIMASASTPKAYTNSTANDTIYVAFYLGLVASDTLKSPIKMAVHRQTSSGTLGFVGYRDIVLDSTRLKTEFTVAKLNNVVWVFYCESVSGDIDLLCKISTNSGTTFPTSGTVSASNKYSDYWIDAKDLPNGAVIVSMYQDSLQSGASNNTTDRVAFSTVQPSNPTNFATPFAISDHPPYWSSASFKPRIILTNNETNFAMIWVGIDGANRRVYFDGSYSIGVNPISSEIPASYSLGQNYPNPFNPITNVKFSILKSEQVKLIVYDIQGREVQTLVNESLKPGTYEATFNGSKLTSGVYFYKLITGDFVETKKMLMIK